MGRLEIFMRGQRLPSPSVVCGLLEHLFASLPGWKRIRVKELLRSGRVHVNGSSVRQHDASVGPRDAVEILDQVGAAKRELPFPLLYEDGELIAINKPNGLLTIGTRYEKVNTAYSVVNYALSKTRERAFVVHRLDRYTSGVLLMAKSVDAQRIVMARWKKARKVYYALVEGVPQKSSGRLEHYLKEDERLMMHASEIASSGAVQARLNWETVEVVKEGHALLKVILETGKKNQIRAQLAAIGHPIAGDRKYGATTDPLNRMCLHAASLTLPHPKSGKLVSFEAPLPRGFRG